MLQKLLYCRFCLGITYRLKRMCTKRINYYNTKYEYIMQYNIKLIIQLTLFYDRFCLYNNYYIIITQHFTVINIVS